MDWQERLYLEKQELDYKLSKLQFFIHSNKFTYLDTTEKANLKIQAAHMESYSDILGERIIRNPFTL